MLRFALGVICSLLFIFTVPVAHAENASLSASKKQSAKKSLAKRKAISALKASKASGKRSRTPFVSNGMVKRAVAVGRRKAFSQRVTFTAVPAAPMLTVGDLAGLNATRDPLALNSNAAFVIDQSTSQILFEKNAHVPLPVASITKLMTGLVVVESNQDMNEVLEVTEEDIDREKNSSSRLRPGFKLTRANMLHIALMSSENRAASALGRNYPGGLSRFVAAMNAKAKALGMHDTHYVDSTGLSSRNIASAQDLAKLAVAAHQYPVLRQYSTDPQYVVDTGFHALQYANSNILVKNPAWEIGLQKTGYISEAGRCLVMQARIEGRPIVMVFLDSKGKQARLADAGRIRKWLESVQGQKIFSGPTIATSS